MLNKLFFIVAFLSAGTLYGQKVQNGQIDLTNYDFSRNAPLELNGFWDFYPAQLVDSNSSGQKRNKFLMEVPLRWDQNDYPSKGFGTYELTVFKNSKVPLALKIPDLFSAYHLYVNEELIASMGVPGTNKESSMPARNVQLVPIAHIDADTLNLKIQVSNFVHRKGGIGHPIILGSYKSLSHQKMIDDAFDFFLAGCLVMGGFFFLGLFFFGRKEQMALYFALFCLTYAYRIVGWGNYVLHDIIDMPFRVGIVLEFSTLYLAVYFFAKYLKNLFPEEVPKLIIRIFEYISLMMAILTVLPVDIVSQINRLFPVLAFAGFALIFYVFIKALINEKPGAKYSMYSTIAISIVFCFKTLAYVGVVKEIGVISVLGQLAFFLFQSLILSKHFSASWREAKSQAEGAAQAKSEFISTMSHELRTPLSAVVGTTDHLLSHNPREDQLKDLDTLKYSSENLLTLVNNVLDFSKIDSGKIELTELDLELKKLCSDVIAIFQRDAERKGIDIKLIYDNELPQIVKTDKGRMNQILTNLIGNALKFTDTGFVKLRVNLVSKDTETAKVQFMVEDSGIGVSEEHHELIFNSFQQANDFVSEKYGGAGLGLSISKQLVEMMGAKIYLTSTPNTGSIFSFTIQMKIGEAHILAKKKEIQYDLSGVNILLVEDNPVNIVIAERLLQKWNAKISTAKNGILAIQKANEEDFDLILMDLRMPDMDGYEATRILRKKQFKKPILAVTASPKEEHKEKMRESGMDGLIVKPYNQEDLYKAISESLESQLT